MYNKTRSSMMRNFIFYFLLTSGVGEVSEKRLFNRGENVLLFKNATADNPLNEVSLYRNGDSNPDLIVKWKIENGGVTATWSVYNYTNIFMDAERNIWIANIDETYKGTYYIQFPQKRVIELTLLGGVYSTTISAVQKEVTKGIKNETTTGWNQEGDNEDNSLLLTEISDRKRDISLMIHAVSTLVVLLLLAIGLIAILIYKIWRKDNANSEQTRPLLKNRRIWTKYFDTLEFMDIKELLNDEQQHGLRAHCEDQKIIVREERKMRKKSRRNKRTGAMKQILRNVYEYLSEAKSFDPNDLE